MVEIWIREQRKKLDEKPITHPVHLSNPGSFNKGVENASFGPKVACKHI